MTSITEISPIQQAKLANWLNNFFPYRFDHIIKTYNGNWRTVHAGLTTPELISILTTSNLILGFGFGEYTRFATFDIDAKKNGKSYLHPNEDNLEFQRFINCLQRLGINSTIIVRSSESGGIHIIVIFNKPYKTNVIAHLLNDHCVSNGFDVESGQLEIFPNVTKTQNAIHQRLRLPLQYGSRVLDQFTLTELSYNLYDLPQLYNEKQQYNDYELFEKEYKKVEKKLEQEKAALSVIANVVEKKRRGAISDNVVEKADRSNCDFYMSDELYERFKNHMAIMGKIDRSRKLGIMHEEYKTLQQVGFTGHGQTNYICLKVTRLLAFFTDFTPSELAIVSYHIIKKLPNYERYASLNSKRTLAQHLISCANTQRKAHKFHLEYNKQRKTTFVETIVETVTEKVVLPVKESIKDFLRSKPTYHTTPAFDRITEILQTMLNDKLCFDFKTHLFKHIAEYYKTSTKTLYEYFDKFAQTELVQNVIRTLLPNNDANIVDEINVEQNPPISQSTLLTLHLVEVQTKIIKQTIVLNLSKIEKVQNRPDQGKSLLTSFQTTPTKVVPWGASRNNQYNHLVPALFMRKVFDNVNFIVDTC